MLGYLEKQNPHWFGEKDPHLERWASMGLRWIPSWIYRLTMKPFSLNFVVGPRRVGKTTGMKIIISKLLEKGVDPRKIVYVDVDLIPELEFFQRLLGFLCEEGFEYIFIDEATSLENWWKPLKGFIDLGLLDGSVVTVSGSVSLKVKKHAELFPGRMGGGVSIDVLPLSFQEVFSALKLKPKAENVRRCFKEYLDTGGFPGSLNHEKSFLHEFIIAFQSEIAKAGLSERITFQIVSSILSKIPSPLSYQSIASDVGIDHKTVRSYIERLENMYILKIAYWKSDGRISFRKEKKIFFRDPFIYHALSYWTGTETLESAIYEGVVQEHLYRRFKEIYYTRNRFEIDCLAGNLRVEVKAGKPHRRYPRNVTLLGKEDIPLFLLKL